MREKKSGKKKRVCVKGAAAKRLLRLHRVPGAIRNPHGTNGLSN
jgi:hypothetical protein